MNTLSYCVQLSREEERIAQMLTRDAWVYFSNLISQREIFHVKEIPMMPRQGFFEIANDAEMIQYYLDYADSYVDELATLGWQECDARKAADSLCQKLENITGLRRGASLEKVGFAS
jgi:hypothetical protein